MVGGAWPLLVGGLNCLVNSDNERDLDPPNSRTGRRLLCAGFEFFCVGGEREKRSGAGGVKLFCFVLIFFFFDCVGGFRVGVWHEWRAE